MTESLRVESVLEYIEARAEAATPGPWDNVNGRILASIAATAVTVACVREHGASGSIADAEFVAAAREDVPRLVAAVSAALAVAEMTTDEVEAIDNAWSAGWNAARYAIRAAVSGALGEAM